MEFKEVTNKAIFFCPMSGTAWLLTGPWLQFKSCWNRSCLTSDLLMSGGGTTTELTSSSGHSLYSYIPSVKCHLFYIYSTEVTKQRTNFLVQPPVPGFTQGYLQTSWKILLHHFVCFSLNYHSLSFYLNLKIRWCYITGPLRATVFKTFST